jgi:hypothetical protein
MCADLIRSWNPEEEEKRLKEEKKRLKNEKEMAEKEAKQLEKEAKKASEKEKKQLQQGEEKSKDAGLSDHSVSVSDSSALTAMMDPIQARLHVLEVGFRALQDQQQRDRDILLQMQAENSLLRQEVKVLSQQLAPLPPKPLTGMRQA